ncbi:sigma-70 family RNA polymerase sigma factor [Ornithinibacillus xuwenensis]|uniref:Sigma-70 family RNA polymerase sigma factor n=1 Tax=Ornithinibacillus xuwenensis TaxID=3144668 RepID=A0ABU9XC45_9BACI
MENWADKLIMEYEQSKRELYNMKNNLGSSEIDKLDKSQINSMIGTVSEAIDWMATGRETGKMRGIDKRAAYQRVAMQDMDMFPSLDIVPEERVLGEDEKRVIFNILAEMTPRQRQCFLLHTVYALSYSDISRELKIGRSTVQKHIERAKEKIFCRTNVVQCS